MPPVWQAARAGLPGDATAVNKSAEVTQLLAAHGITPVWEGAIYPPMVIPSGLTGPQWVDLGTWDIDQPFTMGSAGAVGRVVLPLVPAGAAADVTVSLHADSGGSPGTLICSTRVPASWITQQAATAELITAGGLVTAQSNSMVFGSGANIPWAQPAVSLNGAGNYATPVTSGNYVILLGGWDSVANAAISTVATVQYQGGQSLSGPVPQPPLPQAAWFGMAAATANTVIFTGGNSNGTVVASTWTASWDPATGTVQSWTAQAALPQATVSAAAAAWGTTVYVAGGNTAHTNASAVTNVWYASAVNGQIQSWNTGPSLPQPVTNPYLAVVGNWLICAGGLTPAGTVLNTTYFAAINPDGSLGTWQAGPGLAVVVNAYSPNWNLAVTDSAMIIISGETNGGASGYTQVLPVTSDGPGWAWQAQSCFSAGTYQVVCCQGGVAGQWQLFNLHLTSYDSQALYPLPLISVPLPATGLTPSATYHVVLHQDGGDLGDYTQGVVVENALPAGAQERPAAGGSWISASGFSLYMWVIDQTASGHLTHTWEDSGDRVTSMIYAGAGGKLLGACEATQFGDGTMLAGVTEVGYSGGVPVTATRLA